MNNQIKKIYVTGSFMLFLAVVLGAFGAHAFHEILLSHNRIDTYALANDYHFFHSLGLLCVAIISQLNPTLQHSNAISLTMLLGVVIFSGSLYVLALTNIAWLGAVTPIGGLFLIMSWLLLLFSLVRANRC